MTRTGSADVGVPAGLVGSGRPARHGLSAPRRHATPRPPCPRQPALALPLYLYLLGRYATPICGCSFDPGRDILCILISPPRRLQWP
jgi:hypothetical protein